MIKKGRELVERLKRSYSRQLFEVPVQASVGGENNCKNGYKSFKKKCPLLNVMVGISLERKKLLEKQKEGKKKMKRLGSVEVPQEAFLASFNKR